MKNIKVFILVFILAVSCSSGNSHITETEIIWDTYGVPHIFAEDAQEMYFAYGWAQMHNHANLILKLYGQARGSAAEYWGEEYLVSDQKVRLFSIPEQAKKIYENQNTEFKSYLDAFVEGINAYALEHPEAVDEKMKLVLPINVFDVVGHTLRVTSLEFLAGEDIAIAYQSSQSGSNALAIAPSKSASGNAMLVINPHLPWSDFFLWFEAHLMCDGFNAYGVSLVGMPSITMAFNESLGWAHTINPIDASDRYKLTLKDGGYILDGDVIQFEKKPVSIKIRQTDGTFREQKFEFSYSKHGPVVSQNEANAYAVRIAGFENFGIFEQYHKMAQAADYKEFESAVKMLQNPMFNIIYADKDGNIFYFFNGNIPRRSEGDFAFWKGTIDGSKSELIWDSIHSYDDLPKVKNPPSGFIQNCNDAPWFCTDPPVLDPDDFPPYFSNRWTFMRPQHAVNMIKDNPSISYEKLLEYKHNTEMEAADRFLDDLLLAVNKFPEGEAVKAAEVLKSWDRKTEVHSKGALLFMKWWDKVNNQMFETPWNALDPFTTPDGIKDQEKAVKLLSLAAGEMLNQYGKLDIEWGEVNRFRMNDIDFPANGGPGDYGIFRTIYYAPDSDNCNRAVAGETFVAAVEFGDHVKASVILSYGNSTQPGSIHIGDQLQMLSEKKLRPALLKKADILENTEEIENLSRKNTKRAHN